MNYWHSQLLDRLKALYPDAKDIIVTKSARIGFYLYLKSLNLPAGSSVALPGFTCAAIVNPVLWLGLKPVYIDIDRESLTFDFRKLEEVLDSDPSIKVVMLQHTFGYHGDIAKFVDLARKREVKLVEDCAHALGGMAVSGGDGIEGRPLGSFGDAALISFGLEKILPTRAGGALLINSTDGLLDGKIDQSEIVPMSWVENVRWFINPLLWRFCSLFGNQSVEAAKVLNRAGILDFGLSQRDKKGLKPVELTGLSDYLCKIIVRKLESLEANLESRRSISRIYYKILQDVQNLTLLGSDVNGIPFLRFPILLSTNELRNKLSSKYSIWYDPNIYPGSVDIDAMMYSNGECPVAEDVAKKIFNLPTSIRMSEEEAREVAENVRSKIN